MGNKSINSILPRLALSVTSRNRISSPASPILGVKFRFANTPFSSSVTVITSHERVYQVPGGEGNNKRSSQTGIGNETKGGNRHKKLLGKLKKKKRYVWIKRFCRTLYQLQGVTKETQTTELLENNLKNRTPTSQKLYTRITFKRQQMLYTPPESEMKGSVGTREGLTLS